MSPEPDKGLEYLTAFVSLQPYIPWASEESVNSLSKQYNIWE